MERVILHAKPALSVIGQTASEPYIFPCNPVHKAYYKQKGERL